MLHTDAGTFAVVISWEVFFTNRVRDGVLHGGQVVLNPTNGSSYWLTQVQTQQVASSRLRAVETGRWVLQAAPTGFTAVVDENGELLARSDVSETKVFQGSVPLREGDTIATRVGQYPVIGVALVALLVAWLGARRDRGRRTDPTLAAATHPDEGPPNDGGTSARQPLAGVTANDGRAARRRPEPIVCRTGPVTHLLVAPDDRHRPC